MKISEDHPHHIPLPATPIANGEALGRLIAASQAYVFSCDQDLPLATREQAAYLFDLLQDYGDIWAELSHADRLMAGEDFDQTLAQLGLGGARAYSAVRSTKLLDASGPDQMPLPIMIGYLTVFPAERTIEQLTVPKGSGTHVG